MIDTDATFNVKKARKLLPVNEFQKITTAIRIAKMSHKTPIPTSPIVRISNALARRTQHGHNRATPQMAEPWVVAGETSYPKMETGGGKKMSITTQSRPQNAARAN